VDRPAAGPDPATPLLRSGALVPGRRGGSRRRPGAARLLEALRRLLPAQRRLEERLGELLGGLTAPQAVALAALSGFAEELFFRGAVQGALGWIAASLLFALLHSGPGPEFRLWTLFAACAGLLFGALMLWRGNLLAPALAHFLVNAVNLHRLRRGGAPPA
jgi:membrane protease YdiL (CAAX protease family)